MADVGTVESARESLAYWENILATSTDPKEKQQASEYISHYREELDYFARADQRRLQNAVRYSYTAPQPALTGLEILLSPLYLLELVLEASFIVVMWGAILMFICGAIWGIFH